MGLFDFFKPKKERELQKLVAEIHKETYPNGEKDIVEGTNELLKILNYSIDAQTARTIFMRSTSICYTSILSSGFNKERLKQHLGGYALQYFNDKTISEFYDLLLLNNPKAALIEMANLFSNEMGNNGTDQDEMPEGYGEFGLEITNPIPTSSVLESYNYLNNLTTNSGEKITYQRIGSMSAPNIEAIIDGYNIFSKDCEIATIYICPYNKKTSSKTPKNFNLKN
jgi:hypothetical protein